MSAPEIVVEIVDLANPVTDIALDRRSERHRRRPLDQPGHKNFVLTDEEPDVRQLPGSGCRSFRGTSKTCVISALGGHGSASKLLALNLIRRGGDATG